MVRGIDGDGVGEPFSRLGVPQHVGIGIQLGDKEAGAGFAVQVFNRAVVIRGAGEPAEQIDLTGGVQRQSRAEVHSGAAGAAVQQPLARGIDPGDEQIGVIVASGRLERRAAD
jgi:hypothetical protein